MKLIFTLLIVIVCGAGVFAQNTAPNPRRINGTPTQILLTDTARYEIIAETGTQLMKLDRYTGKTYWIGSTGFMGKRKWIRYDVVGGLPTSTDQTPKYQIISESSLLLLFNTETGQTWMFTGSRWELIPD